MRRYSRENKRKTQKQKKRKKAIFTEIHNQANYGRAIVFYCKGPQQDQTAKEELSFVASLTSLFFAKVPVAVPL